MLILSSYRPHAGEENMGFYQAFSLKVFRRDRETPSAKKPGKDMVSLLII